MESTLFFPKTVHREIRIRSLALLVGKPPELSKRLKLLLSMPLSGKASVGMPGWLADAWEFVEKTKDEVSQHTQFGAVDLQFSGDDLFSKPAKAPKSQLNKFAVVSVGDKEEPDTELQFVAYAPFSKGLLDWCGQFAGHAIWANFDLIGGSDGASKPAAKQDEPSADEQELFAEDSELMKPEHDLEFETRVTKKAGAKPAKKKGGKAK